LKDIGRVLEDRRTVHRFDEIVEVRVWLSVLAWNDDVLSEDSLHIRIKVRCDCGVFGRQPRGDGELLYGYQVGLRIGGLNRF